MSEENYLWRYEDAVESPKVSGRVAVQLQEFYRRVPALVKLFTKAGSAFVGLDVGSYCVKAVLLRRGPEGFSLKGFSTSNIPPGADTSGRAGSISQVVRALDPEARHVVTAVGGGGAVLRAILLPKMTPQELKTALSFEAEKHIPFKLEEAFLDACILGDRPGGRMEVFLAAARKELVQSHLALLSQAGVAPQVLDLEASALANAWEVSHPQDVSSNPVIGLLHVGSRATIVSVFSGVALQFTREIPCAGDGFTQGIVQALQVDTPSAEKLKRDPGERSADVGAALRTPLEEWLSQCRSSFDFYENQFGRGLERLFLSGGSACLKGLSEGLKEATGLPVDLWDPCSGFQVEADSSGPRQARGAFAVAIGLAVRGFAK